MNRRLILIALLAACLAGCAGSGSGSAGSSPALGWCCDTRQIGKFCDVGDTGLPLGTGCRCGSNAGIVVRCN